jgi:hypothetical protein
MAIIGVFLIVTNMIMMSSDDAARATVGVPHTNPTPKPDPKPASKLTSKPKSKRAVKPASEPAAKPTSELVAKPNTEPASKPAKPSPVDSVMDLDLLEEMPPAKEIGKFFDD